MTSFERLEFWAGSEIFGKSVYPCLQHNETITVNKEQGLKQKKSTIPEVGLPLCIRNDAVFDESTVEPVYNDIGLCDTSYITSDILWYQLIPHC